MGGISLPLVASEDQRTGLLKPENIPFVGIRMHRTTVHAHTTSPTQIYWDSGNALKIYDTSGFFQEARNNWIFTVPPGLGGFYRIQGSVHMNEVTVNTRVHFFIRRYTQGIPTILSPAGSHNIAATAMDLPGVAVGVIQPFQSAACTYPLKEGDSVAWIYEGSTGRVFGDGNPWTTFEMYRLGGA